MIVRKNLRTIARTKYQPYYLTGVKCDICGAPAVERHHITYYPPEFAPLCKLCHAWVTDENCRHPVPSTRRIRYFKLKEKGIIPLPVPMGC